MKVFLLYRHIIAGRYKRRRIIPRFSTNGVKISKAQMAKSIVNCIIGVGGSGVDIGFVYK